jgi:hypothetical protein
MADDDQHVRNTRHGHHVIQVTATRGPNGRWWWSYLVDDGTTNGQGRVPCPAAEAALRQGLNAAKARIGSA